MSDALKRYQAAITAQNEASWALDDAERELRAAQEEVQRAHYAASHAHPDHFATQRDWYARALQREATAKARIAELRPALEAARAATADAYVYTPGKRDNRPPHRGRAVGLV
jgi:hypothetical protein